VTTIGFLHTAEVHVATFRGLFTELAPPGLTDLHLVDESLLADARRTGSAPGLAGRLHELATAGADLIVCTCSTIGADAEATDVPMPLPSLTQPPSPSTHPAQPATLPTHPDQPATVPTHHDQPATVPTHHDQPATLPIRHDQPTAGTVPVMRLDRPMAEAAVAAGERIVVIATVESTLEPTVALIRATADSAGRRVTVVASPCLAAWQHFEGGDIATYDKAIAAHVRSVAGDADAIVLAQAGMAGAAALLPDLPVLTSPRAAVKAALLRAASLR
jgi:hypothetical protein